MVIPAVLTQSIAQRRALHSIAAVEAFKGILAIAAGVGLIGLLGDNLHAVAAALIGHIGLDPGAHYPALVLHDVDRLRGVDLRSLLALASAYALLRFFESYGLWHELAWGEWLGALSGALYVPFELRHLVHRPTAVPAIVITANVVVVGFLAWQIWRRPHRMSARLPDELQP